MFAVVVLAGAALSTVGTAHADDFSTLANGDGTTFSWQSEHGNGTITFDPNRFEGSAQFPNEGPIR
ncbi:DUF1964 domain-containing protein [Streptomyces sp. McG3]|uniref:DUF1964 domain-containing protein n=1 Tax=Streptomyces sp. McG3 TaxID=2725483 RepID=UPI001BEC523A|nr:DUF1964 domain-containing protein [Streptomyces sp. McG3]MBT2896846.1 DUF1964 domain-containing protein [Streptomyces sp. McG3]